MAEKLVDKKHIFVLGKGYGEPVAYEVKSLQTTVGVGADAFFFCVLRSGVGVLGGTVGSL